MPVPHGSNKLQSCKPVPAKHSFWDPETSEKFRVPKKPMKTPHLEMQCFC